MPEGAPKNEKPPLDYVARHFSKAMEREPLSGKLREIIDSDAHSPIATTSVTTR